MEAVAIARSVRISPRKVRLVADVVRKKSASNAFAVLTLIQKRAAKIIEKILKSAIANAKNKNMKEDALVIKMLEVTEGAALKRYHPSTRGRIHPYKRRSSHIRIVLSDDKSQISNIKFQMKKEK